MGPVRWPAGLARPDRRGVPGIGQDRCGADRRERPARRGQLRQSSHPGPFHRLPGSADVLDRPLGGPRHNTGYRYQNLWGKHDPGPQITCVVMREFASCYTEVYAIFDRFREKTILLPGRLVNPAVAVRRSRQARFRRAGLAPRPCAADLAQGLNDPAAGARPVGREAGRDEVSEAEVTTGTCSAQTRP
jgi:hypothetical protein